MLRSAEIGLLSTVGHVGGIKVYRKPMIGLVSSGNELVDAAEKNLPDGMIRDSNKAMLMSLLW